MKLEDRIQKIENGQDLNCYKFLGAHIAKNDGKYGTYFRVYSKNAKRIFVIGDFNNFEEKDELKRIKESNVWECFVFNAKQKQRYKFVIIDENGNKLYKTDPFAFFAQNLQNDKDFSCIISKYDDYKWKDEKYFEQKKDVNLFSSPINIYEVCLLSWKKHADGSYYTYRELASSLVPYCKKMGYTHIELLPITEFQLDKSWGYEVTNYFAITSRFGSINDLKYFVDKCHSAGIGVILDWVPGHFDTSETNSEDRKSLCTDDDFGLTEWDGKCLFESSKWDRKWQLAWGTRIFDYENPFVTNFLISSALFFLREYHFDGLRIDAVSSILYLDFCRNADEWLPNHDGNNKNYAGEAFLKNLNNSVFFEFPNALMIAEEVTGWPMVTKPTSMGGLGFNFKWNIGWINDFWEYTSMDPYFRKYHHNIITHSIDYCFDENFILPVDHDEVANGRHSLIEKMNGEMKTKIDLCRAFYTYMFMHPGKKLSFMGCEFGQTTEWNYKKPINFSLLNSNKNKQLQKFVASLNKLYVKLPQLFEIDFDKNGFEWLANDNKECVTAFKRYALDGSYLICVCNFSPNFLDDYVLGVDECGTYEEIFSSDYEIFGGTNIKNENMHSSIMNKNGKSNIIRIDLAPNSAIVIKKI